MRALRSAGGGQHNPGEERKADHREISESAYQCHQWTDFSPRGFFYGHEGTHWRSYLPPFSLGNRFWGLMALLEQGTYARAFDKQERTQQVGTATRIVREPFGNVRL